MHFRNIECGTIHCQGGSDKPIIHQGTYTSHTQTVNGQEVHCKIMGTEFNDMGEDYGMVQDGSKCGDEMVKLFFRSRKFSPTYLDPFLSSLSHSSRSA